MSDKRIPHFFSMAPSYFFFNNKKFRVIDFRRLNYESFKDNIGTVNNILPWLIGKDGYLSSKLCKQNPDSMRMRVKNYSELVDKLNDLGMSKYIVE
jgi:hypothetical protein